MSERFRFDPFTLDVGERRLWRGGTTVDVSSRYLDALALLVRENGRLVTKDRFMAEVWRGIPVTDEALTQCIRTLRRSLGDEAGQPRFIATVPKHGYRFVAPVQCGAGGDEGGSTRAGGSGAIARRVIAGTGGAGVAGVIGGIFYGFCATSTADGAPSSASPGALSIVAVMTLACVTVALLGGAGVAGGIALAQQAPARRGAWTIVGGALGGLMVGAAVKLFGIDAFTLLVGGAPADITGPGEGAMLGAGVGLGMLFAARSAAWRWHRAMAAALPGAAAGLFITLLGGRLMAGSLASLGTTFPAARLRLDRIGLLFGEQGVGPIANEVTGTLEGALFALGVVAAMRLADRRTSD